VFVKTTLAFGTSAPAESVTVPDSDAFVVCAIIRVGAMAVGMATAKATAEYRHTVLNLSVDFNFNPICCLQNFYCGRYRYHAGTTNPGPLQVDEHFSTEQVNISSHLQAYL
jgi:hypothetical protein